MFRLLCMSLFTCLLFLTGCSKDTSEQKAVSQDQGQQTETNTTNKETSTEAEKPEVEEQEKEQPINDEYKKYATEDPETMVQLEPGPYSGDNYDIEAIKQEIDQFPVGETVDDYYYRFISLIAEDYRFFHETMQNVDTSYQDPTEGPDGELSAPPEEQSRQINVQILFDASGSMAAELGGKSKMTLAKDAVQSFVEELPEGVHVSLRVYGHKGTSKNADKELSCQSSEEIYPLGSFDQAKFSKALDQFSPAGWTPLAASIEAAMDDLKEQTGEHTENIIYVVSDGVETCDGDPVQAAKKLNESDVEAIVHIIGFDVNDAGQRALKKVAEAGKGQYATVRSQQDFQKFFEKEKRDLRHEWIKWSNDHVQSYMESQQERVDELFDIENEAKALTQLEEKRLEEMVNYWNENLSEEDEPDLKISSIHVGRRGRELRSYLFSTAVEFRNELRSKGLEMRDQVRDKALKERNKLKN